MKRVAKHQRSAGFGRRRAGRAAKHCLRATEANLGFFDRMTKRLPSLPQFIPQNRKPHEKMHFGTHRPEKTALLHLKSGARPSHSKRFCNRPLLGGFTAAAPFAIRTFEKALPFVMQRLDGLELAGFVRGIQAEDHADQDGEADRHPRHVHRDGQGHVQNRPQKLHQSHR